MDDNKIIDLFWQRSEEGLAEVSAKYAKYCHSIAYRILGSNEDAEECVNDTWLRAWNAIPPARPGRLSTFLGKITRNLSLNRYEKQHAEKRGGGAVEIAIAELEDCLPARASVEEEVEENILAALVDNFLDTLPLRSRDVFVQRYWYLCSITDISTDLGLSENNVKSMLFRTRNKLKHYLEREGIAI
ncbi:MAG: sigma-70 family RNA polymerase sigma factor [Lachnospiraceae bacterium]|jgi:RNA polymerase sigma-70 factor (ECF subfamily)|nr:sigma-70 family RNA polymerase sigma factor [Lachnospiraceae bacterium]